MIINDNYGSPEHQLSQQVKREREHVAGVHQRGEEEGEDQHLLHRQPLLRPGQDRDPEQVPAGGGEDHDVLGRPGESQLEGNFDQEDAC